MLKIPIGKQNNEYWLHSYSALREIILPLLLWQVPWKPPLIFQLHAHKEWNNEIIQNITQAPH